MIRLCTGWNVCADRVDRPGNTVEDQVGNRIERAGRSLTRVTENHTANAEFILWVVLRACMAGLSSHR